MHAVLAQNRIRVHGQIMVVWILDLEEHLVVCLSQAFEVGHELLVNRLLVLKHKVQLLHRQIDVFTLDRSFVEFEYFLVDFAGVYGLSQVEDFVLA